MNQLASPSQLRMSFLRWALFVVPAIMFLGFLSGAVSGSGDENSWFAELIKPDAQPPGWVFGATWTALYLMIAFAFSMILHARGARSRGLAIGLFMAQFLLNLSWSPIFFGRHQVTMAFYLILLILVLKNLKEKKNKAKLELNRETQRLSQVKLLSPMSGRSPAKAPNARSTAWR